MECLAKIRKKIKKCLSDDSSGHDFYHAVRVYNLGGKIAEEEKADSLIVSASAYLHDLFRPQEKELGILNYHVSSGALAEIEKILNEVKFPEEKISAVLKAIRLHEDYSFGINTGEENTLEGSVLQDADRLDAIGAIGIARCFMFSGHYRRPLWIPQGAVGERSYDPANLGESAIRHFYDKLLKIKGAMNTSVGRKMAEERHQFMEEFLEKFFKEWEGKS